MTEEVVLDCGDYGQVLLNRDEAYARAWLSGPADDPRGLEIMEAQLQVIATHRLRYWIVDLSRVVGAPSVAHMERLGEIVPAMVRAGCRTQFTVMPGTAAVLTTHARTYQSRKLEHGLETIEVPSAEAAIQHIRAANGRSPDRG